MPDLFQDEMRCKPIVHHIVLSSVFQKCCFDEGRVLFFSPPVNLSKIEGTS